MNRDKLIQDLRRDEGVKHKVYKDSLGILTIGVGRNLEDRGLTNPEIDYLLSNDINAFRVELNNAFPWWVHMQEPWMRGLLNMCFNMGISRLRGFKKMLAALEGGNGEEAAVQALDSKWARQVGARAARIVELFRSG